MYTSRVPGTDAIVSRSSKLSAGQRFYTRHMSLHVVDLSNISVACGWERKTSSSLALDEVFFAEVRQTNATADSLSPPWPLRAASTLRW